MFYKVKFDLDRANRAGEFPRLEDSAAVETRLNFWITRSSRVMTIGLFLVIARLDRAIQGFSAISKSLDPAIKSRGDENENTAAYYYCIRPVRMSVKN